MRIPASPPDGATPDALVVVDVVSTFEHADADRLLASFRERAGGMSAALAEARGRGVPVVYVNDACGNWDGDAPDRVRAALAGRGGDVIAPLAPRPREAFLFKPRYSGFDRTPLRDVLGELGVERVLLAGAATEGCVVQTGIDAREQGLKVTIVTGACATADERLERVALEYAERVGGMNLVPAL